ncbi:MacB-like protein [Chitinophaga dinghuensis]|uniref:MacB-like protein n=1 Tax=Chitinophaga dinghuensis TaxID=1539050 RepID=A0A327W3X1_9BACT|nr:ABC transporter permease [Chitinophaga dinghuensis]RAJ83482.1 MacB-like protein [Chitinophaga dinghuensis]
MIRNYFKVALRNLVKNKTYGLLNILGLALSLTCGILIAMTVQFHLSFDNFHKDSDRIYRFVTEQHRDRIFYSASVPPPLGKAFIHDYTSAEDMCRVVDPGPVLLTMKSGSDIKKIKEESGVVFADPSYLKMFSFQLLQGNAQTLDEPNTAIISSSIAQKYFGDKDPINQVLYYDNKQAVRITGVIQDLPRNTDLKGKIILSWPTVKVYNDWFLKDDSWGGIASGLNSYVRLKPNANVAAIEKDLQLYVKRYRPTNKNVHHYLLQPLADVHFNAHYDGVMEKKNLWILSLIGVFLLITACMNFINLATAQALNRSKEVGIRKALGSFRGQLFWQFIAETGVITITATLLAIILSYFTLPFFGSMFNAEIPFHLFNNPLLPSIILLMVVVVTFLAGAYPGLILSGFKPVEALKGKLSFQQLGGFNTRRSLIVVQFSISLVLIIAMLVITRQMQYAKEFNMGFDKEAIVMVPVGTEEQDISRMTLRRELEAIPGVQNASICYSSPSSNSNWTTTITFDNRQEPEAFHASIKGIDENYLSTFGLKLVAGKNVFPADSVREFIVNETMVHKLGLASPEEALGKLVSISSGAFVATITGVVADFHDGSLHDDIGAVAMAIYPDQYEYYAVKLDTRRMLTTLPAIEKVWNAMYPEKMYSFQFLDDRIAEFYTTEETMLKIIRMFSLLAIFIACLGLYGLVSFMVVQKRKEIGIRKLLGGTIPGILWLFGKEFGRLILISFLFAAPLGWWLMSNWLNDFRYHVELGPGVFGVAIIVTIIIAALTVGMQSIRAAMVNPAKSLKSE